MKYLKTTSLLLACGFVSFPLALSCVHATSIEAIPLDLQVARSTYVLHIRVVEVKNSSAGGSDFDGYGANDPIEMQRNAPYPPIHIQTVQFELIAAYAGMTDGKRLIISHWAREDMDYLSPGFEPGEYIAFLNYDIQRKHFVPSHQTKRAPVKDGGITIWTKGKEEGADYTYMRVSLNALADVVRRLKKVKP